jgi:prepilin-type N-terminal cleavage/methylation domain-containing protein/prepilin-type processing-associated H-X9-DG protein
LREKDATNHSKRGYYSHNPSGIFDAPQPMELPMKRCPNSFLRAFTLIELLIVVACLGILAALLLPAFAPATNCSFGCVNNLKQMGVAFRTWALDNRDNYPPQISIANGGTMELVNSGVVFSHFQVMSNELSTPKILVCPDDASRQTLTATTFASAVPSGSPYAIPFTNDIQVSYFIGVDAQDTRPAMFLSGDANLGIEGTALKSGLQSFSTNSQVAWFRPRHENGKKGNIGLADGSVKVFNTSELRQALRESGVTNRLAIPRFP